MSKWNFPTFTFGSESGVSDSGSVHFSDNPVRSLIRECIQNSIDARDNMSLPVGIRVSVHDVKAKDIPDWSNLKLSLEAMVAEAEKQVGQGSFNSTVTGLRTLLSKVDSTGIIRILEFSDYNTTGLVGAGQAREQQNRFYRLLFQPGMNNSTGDKGGTWGLGKFAPFAASHLRTVFYSTFTSELKNSVLIGKSVLADHAIMGQRYNGTGYFGELGDRIF